MDSASKKVSVPFNPQVPNPEGNISSQQGAQPEIPDPESIIKPLPVKPTIQEEIDSDLQKRIEEKEKSNV